MDDDTAWVEAYRQRLDAPAAHFPSTRCMSGHTWSRLFRDIASTEKGHGRKVPTQKAALDTLLKLGIMSRIPLEAPTGRPQAPPLYVVDFRPDASEHVDPIEILVALAPEDGVLCYGTALHYFGLTTQVLPHHVARPHPERTVAAPRPTPSLDATFTKIGTLIGVYQGRSYYVTLRSTRWLVRHQSRMFDDRTIFRITTREQTMVDALFRPTYCGGAGVVFEAWEQVRDTLNATALSEILAQIDDNALTRRVGWMFENVVGHVPEPVEALVQVARAAALTERAVSPLLPGCPHRTVDPDWLLAVP